MAERFANERELAEAIRGLPREMQPGRDPWPDIQARLNAAGQASPRRRRAWRASAIAASVLVAFAAGLLLGRQAAFQPGQPETAGEDVGGLAMRVALQASEREYQAAFQAFTPIGMNPQYIEPAAAQDIENSWADLKQAEVALLAALDEHPDNRFLAEKLLNLRAQQLEFLRQIYVLDQNSRRSI